MLLQIAVRVPDSSDPLGLLAAGLRRHLSRLRTLSFASAHALDADEQAREQALAELDEALAFFERAADDPFRDESDLLFPQLLARTAGDTELAQACATLEGDRLRAAGLHRLVAENGSMLVGAATDPSRVRELVEAVDALESLYREHLERLEAQVFPRAENALSDVEKRGLAAGMLASGGATVLTEASGPEQPLGAGLP